MELLPLTDEEVAVHLLQQDELLIMLLATGSRVLLPSQQSIYDPYGAHMGYNVGPIWATHIDPIWGLYGSHMGPIWALYGAYIGSL